jgi:hypothetical protein
MTGPRVTAAWFNPTAGRVAAAPGSPYSPTAPRRVRPVATLNGAGFDDWVLILKAQL